MHLCLSARQTLSSQYVLYIIAICCLLIQNAAQCNLRFQSQFISKCLNKAIVGRLIALAVCLRV